MSINNIFLTEPERSSTVRILQLFPHLELFSDGDPIRNSLFIMAAAPQFSLPGVEGDADQLLIVDPPDDVTARFKLEGNVAALFTGIPRDVGLPVVENRNGGVAHVRIGDHFLDVYGHHGGAIVFLPALGVLCGGSYGSDGSLPQFAPGSDGSAELEVLRLAARLLKQRALQMYIPQWGSTSDDTIEVMERLAVDVAYLHAMRRVLSKALEQGEALEHIEVLADSLLPATRDSDHCRAVHDENVAVLLETIRSSVS